MPSISISRRLLIRSGVMLDKGAWLSEGRLLACAYPRSLNALSYLAQNGVSLLVNLDDRAHNAKQLGLLSLAEVHIPVRDFTAPTLDQLRRGVAAIRDALDEGRVVAVHCGGGLGRTGCLLACYLVDQGLSATEAVAK